MGYQRAGFDVAGVDIEAMPRYPFPFSQGDAIRVLELIASGEVPPPSAIHVSPPCQDHMRGGLAGKHGTGWMLGASRELLQQTGVPWVIENVPGAPMRPDFMLCGSHFGLPVRRHRWFETSWNALALMPFQCDHSGPVVGVYGHPHGRRGAWPGMLPGTIENWQRGLGIDWTANADDMRQAIPPAYTEYMGGILMEHLQQERAA